MAESSEQKKEEKPVPPEEGKEAAAPQEKPSANPRVILNELEKEAAQPAGQGADPMPSAANEEAPPTPEISPQTPTEIHQSDQSPRAEQLISEAMRQLDELIHIIKEKRTKGQ